MDRNKIEVVLSMIDKATAPFQAFNKRVESAVAPIQRLNNRLALLAKESGIGKLTDAAGGVASSIKGVFDEVTSLAMKVGAGVGIVGGAIFGLVKMTSDAADAFDELSTKAGVSVEFFQKSAYAASFASVSQEALAAAMGKMNANIVAANTGGKEMQVWFKRAGINAAELRKMKPEEVFGKVLDKVKELPKDSAKAGALMRAIFGKSGGDLLPMVESFRELSEEAEKLGLVISKETIAAGAEFNDQFDKTVKIVRAVGMSIGAQLMPHVQKIIILFSDWVQQNRELISTKVAGWIESLRQHWPEIKQGAIEAFAAIREIIEFVRGAVQFVGGFGNALKLVGLVMAGPLLMAIGGVVKAIWLLGAAIGGTPVGWFLAAVLAIGLAAKVIYDNWEPIKKFFSDLWKEIGGIFDNGIGGVTEKLWRLMRFTPFGMLANLGGKLAGVDIFGESSAAKAPGSAQALSNDSGGFRLGGSAGFAPAAANRLGSGFSSTTNNAKVEVDFKNVPRGVQVTPAQGNSAPLDLSMGYANASF